MEVEHYSGLLFDDGIREEYIDGVRYLRAGNNTAVIVHAMGHYYRNQRVLLPWLIVNTHRFFSSLWITTSGSFFIHQLTREIKRMYPGVRTHQNFETVMLKMKE